MATDDTKITQSTSHLELPDPPERQYDERTSNVDYLHMPGNTHHVSQYLGNRETTLVTADRYITMMPERQLPSGQTRRVPDLLIAFDVDPELYQAKNGYVVQLQGKSPDFVLEVASVSTGDDDTGPKRDDYAALGILEYWRFDKTGEFYGTKLAGDRLVDGVYEPIPIDKLDDGSLQGYSAALNLILRWEQEKLAWHDPATGQHIPTFDSERARADQARTVRLAAEERIAAANARADTEHTARLAAEERATAAEARIRELEARVYNTDL